MVEKFGASRNGWILVEIGVNGLPNVYPCLPQNAKWVNKMAVLGKHAGKQIAISIVNKDNTED